MCYVLIWAKFFEFVIKESSGCDMDKKPKKIEEIRVWTAPSHFVALKEAEAQKQILS